jgi:HEPN domain-containing protein
MTPEEKVEHWLDIAEYDLETARAMQHSGRFLYTVFMCQQALEKLLKAIHIHQKGEEAPRTHNLSYLFELLDLPEDTEYLQTMTRLTAYYIKGRYPTYKQKLSQMLDKKASQVFLDETQEIYQWLKSQLPLSNP